MFFRKCMVMTLGVAAGMLSVVADDTATLPQSFEGATVEAAVTTLTGWTGYGTISNTTDQTNLAAGTPISGDHAKHLAVEGWVTAAFDTTDETTGVKDRELDMLVKVALPDDALSTMSDADAKFALAIDTDHKLKYWTGSAWTAVSTTTYNEGQWIRVVVVCDSTNKKCKVTVDGQTALYATNDPWFPMISTATTAALASMKIVGTTEIDDVVLSKTAVADYASEYKDASGNVITAGATDVPMSWCEKNNITTNMVTTVSDTNSGLTYEQKYILGQAVSNTTKFEMKAVSMTKSDSKVNVVITAPEFGTLATGYKAKVQYLQDNGSWTTDTEVTSGQTVNIELPSGTDVKVTKFRITVTK